MTAERTRIRNLIIHRPIIYGNTARLLTPEERVEPVPSEHTHRWTVAVRSAASDPDSDIVGGADDLSHFIKRVTFKLHDTYTNQSRAIDKPPFEVSETGWGEFEVQIRIGFTPESGEKPITFYHHLKLHPWTANGELEVPPPEVALQHGPVHSWQYDEIVFSDPFSNFLTTLTAHPPTPLPATKRRLAPFHSAFPGGLEESKSGGVPEFSQAMEKEEAQRLIKAKQTVLAEQEKWREILLEKEKELEKLQQQLNS
jgi:YEATS domain-containing protein 4